MSVKYFCDICGKEIDSRRNIIGIIMQKGYVHDDNNIWAIKRIEGCHDCIDALEKRLKAFLESDEAN